MQNTKALLRGRVDRELEAIFEYPMTVVAAPMGYGKTTAVRQFLDSRDSQVLWLSFVAPDESGAFFWQEFSHEIGRLDSAMGERLCSLGFPQDSPETAVVLSVLNTLHCKERTVFVIDDFHLAKNPRIGEVLSQIAKEELENLHIVIVTRDTANLDFGEMVSRGCSPNDFCGSPNWRHASIVPSTGRGLPMKIYGDSWNTRVGASLLCTSFFSARISDCRSA